MITDDLQKLAELQELDNQIFKIKAAKQDFPAKVTHLEATLKTAQDVVDEAQQAQRDLEGKKKDFQDKMSNAETSLKRSQERLNSISTNREYDAVHAEIESNTHLISTAQGGLKKLDDEIATAAQGVTEAQEALGALRAEHEPVMTELKEKIGTFDSQIEAVDKGRAVLLPQISKGTMRIYDHIRARRKTAQFLSRVNDRQRSCSYCHKVLEMQLINEIKKGTKLISCQSCGSIMSWDNGTTAPAGDSV